jgi:D-alanine-D-alanine ligase
MTGSPERTTGRRLRVAVLFGGRSGEHEVSLMSARSVVAALDPEKYDVVGIGITREGRWLLTGDPLNRLLAEAGASFEERPSTRAIALAPDPSTATLVPLDGRAPRDALAAGSDRRPDVVIPLVHGTHGEDGTLQGLLDLAEIPYVGSGVLGSAVGMDKAVFKAVMQAAGVPVTPFRLVHVARGTPPSRAQLAGLGGELGYPLFVKPSNGGSSLGVTKVKREEDLERAVREAADYDPRVLLERAIAGRELECAVLGNDAPEASVVGEVVPGHEFYDYDDKYFDDKARTVVPADIPAAKAAEARALAIRAFRAIDAAGMARVDFFLEEGSGNLYVNEINTIPGFTRISMYPKLWEASGVPFPLLLDRLILLGLQRAEGMRARKLTP